METADVFWIVMAIAVVAAIVVQLVMDRKKSTRNKG